MTSPTVFTALKDFKDAQDQSTVDAQNFTISQATSGYRNPSWVSRYPIGDVSYPEALNNAHVVSGTTLGPSAGTNHTHSLTTGNINNGAGPTAATIPQNTSMGTYLTISQTTVMDKVSIYAYKTAGSVNNVYVEVFKENADGSLTRYVSVDVSALLSTSAVFLETSISGGLIVQAGERWLIRLRNSSSVANDLGLASVVWTSLSPDITFATSGSVLTAQSSYTNAEAITARNISSFVNFVCMGATGLIKSDRSYSDDFNRSSLGEFWYTTSSTASKMTISGNKAAYNGLTNGDQNAIYTKTTNGDDSVVSGTIYNNFLSVAGAYLGFLLHSNADMTSLVYLAINNAGAKIYSGSSTSLTQRATISRIFNEGTWSLEYDTATTTYTAKLNGDPVGLTWNDSGAAKPRGSLYRYGGMRISLATLLAGGQIDDWKLKDRTM